MRSSASRCSFALHERTAKPGSGLGTAKGWSGLHQPGCGSGRASRQLGQQQRAPCPCVDVGGFWIDLDRGHQRRVPELCSCRFLHAAAPHRGLRRPQSRGPPGAVGRLVSGEELRRAGGERLATEGRGEDRESRRPETAFPWGAAGTGRANAMGTAETIRGAAPLRSPASSPTCGGSTISSVTPASGSRMCTTRASPSPRDGRAWLQETGLAGERRRVVRGGGYDDPSSRQRVSRRAGRRPDDFHRTVGFRCVADE